MLLMFLFSAIGIAVAVVIRIDVIITGRFRQSAETFQAAQAALNVAIAELRREPSWSAVLSGERQSSLAQGVFLGIKNVPGGGGVHVCCGTGSAFDRLASDTRTSRVPARRALVWRPFLWTTFHALVPQDPPSRLFVIVFVTDDEEDAVSGEGDTNGVVLLRAEASDPAGLLRSVEALVVRGAASEPDRGADGAASSTPAAPAAPWLGVLTWREVRH